MYNHNSARNHGYQGVQVVARPVRWTKSEWKEMDPVERGRIFSQFVNDWVSQHLRIEDVRYTRLNVNDPSIQVTCSIAKMLHLYYLTFEFEPEIQEEEDVLDDEESVDVLAEPGDSET